MDLLISQNFHVHAFVYAENWRAISDIIVEGGVYIITSFYTKMATGTFRPTRSKIVINFSNSKRVEKVPGDDFIIPNHKFDFIDVSDLHNTAESYEDLEKQDFAAGFSNYNILHVDTFSVFIIMFEFNNTIFFILNKSLTLSIFYFKLIIKTLYFLF